MAQFFTKNPTGNVPSGTPDTGSPVKAAGVYNATTPTFTDGDRVDFQMDVNGNVKVNLATILSCLVNGVQQDSIGVASYRRTDAIQASINFASSSAQTVVSGVTAKNIHLTDLTISSDGGVACNVLLRDNAGSPVTVVNKLYFGTSPQTITLHFATPKQVSLSNSLLAVCSSGTPNITVDISGYQI